MKNRYVEGMIFRGAGDLVTISDPQAMPTDGLLSFWHAPQHAVAAGPPFGSRNIVQTLLSTRTWFGRQEISERRHGLFYQLASVPKRVLACLQSVCQYRFSLNHCSPFGNLSLFPVSVHKTNLLFVLVGFQMTKCNEFLQDWGAIIFLDTASQSGVWKFVLLVIGSTHVVPEHHILLCSFIKASLFLTSDSCTHLLQYSFPLGGFCSYVCSLSLT